MSESKSYDDKYVFVFYLIFAFTINLVLAMFSYLPNGLFGSDLSGALIVGLVALFYFGNNENMKELFIKNGLETKDFQYYVLYLYYVFFIIVSKIIMLKFEPLYFLNNDILTSDFMYSLFSILIVTFFMTSHNKRIIIKYEPYDYIKTITKKYGNGETNTEEKIIKKDSNLKVIIKGIIFILLGTIFIYLLLNSANIVKYIF